MLNELSKLRKKTARRINKQVDAKTLQAFDITNKEKILIVDESIVNATTIEHATIEDSVSGDNTKGKCLQIGN